MNPSKLRNLPALMQTTDAWLVANADKIPLIPNSNTRISGDKSRHTQPFSVVIGLIEQGNHDHAVFYHSDHNSIASLDIDHCQDAETHTLVPWCEQFINDNPIGYMESSSSGTGLRICGIIGTKTLNKQVFYIHKEHYRIPAPAQAEKVEVMISNCLATYTGDVHPLCTEPDRMTELEPVLTWLNQHYPRPERTPTPTTGSVLREHPTTTREQVLDALHCIPPDINHDDWKQIGMALHDWCPVDGEELWINWSQGSDQFKNDRECRIAWSSFAHGGIRIGTLFHHAKQHGFTPKPATHEASQAPATDDVPMTEPAPAPPASVNTLPPIPMMKGDSIMNLPVVPYLVDSLLPETGFVQWFGNSGTFKSFLALDLAMAVTSGTEWFGHKTQQGSVVYLCGEGVYGMGARLRAWTTKDISTDMDALNMSIYIPDLSNFDMLGGLINYFKSLVDLKLIVVDTFARAMIHIGNENDNSDIARYNRIIDYIRNQLKVLILQVHHTGHANKERSRGASGLYAALDAEYQCVRLGERDGYLKCTKAKDFPEPEPVNFTMKPVQVNDQSSLIVTERTNPVPTSRQEAMEATWEKTLTDKQLQIMNTYYALYALHETHANANDNVTPRVLMSDLKDQLTTAGVCSKDHVSRDVGKLLKNKILLQEGIYVSVYK